HAGDRTEREELTSPRRLVRVKELRLKRGRALLSELFGIDDDRRRLERRRLSDHFEGPCASRLELRVDRDGGGIERDQIDAVSVHEIIERIFDVRILVLAKRRTGIRLGIDVLWYRGIDAEMSTGLERRAFAHQDDARIIALSHLEPLRAPGLLL